MTLSFTASSTSGIECRVQRYDFFMKLKKIMKEKCKNRQKRHKKAPIPSATYRPAIGQLSASYKKTEDANVSFLLPIERQNLNRIYAESTPNLRRTYAEPTSNLRRIYVEPTSNLRRTYIGNHWKMSGCVFYVWGYIPIRFSQIPIKRSYTIYPLAV